MGQNLARPEKSGLGLMYDAAGENRKDGRGRRRTAEVATKHGQVCGLADLERANLLLPSERAGAVVRQSSQRLLPVEARGLGFGPQVQVADAHDGIGAEADAEPRGPKRGKGCRAVAVRGVRSRTVG